MTIDPDVSGGRSSSRSSAERKKLRRERTRIAVAAILLIVLIAFVIDNSQTVKVGFVFFSAQVSLIWVLIITAVLGAACDRLVILLRARRKSKATHSPPA